MYIAPKSQKRIGALYGAARWQDRLTESSCLKMTSERRVCLGLADVKRYRVPYFGRRDTKSASTKWKVASRNRKWLADERVDLADLWYCKRSVRYGRWPDLRTL